MKYGVLGKSLPHTYSPQIHACFADYEYGILERSEEGVHGIFEGREDLQGFNITIPYKKLAMSLCREVSPEASEVGAVNTVVKLPDGGFKGYNTDVFGFIYMLEREGIDVNGRKCLILGTGGASAAVLYALKKLGASKISFCSRSGEINYTNVYDELPDTEVIINATPVGMFPEVDNCPIELERFGSLIGVADIIYNPSRTRFLQEGERLGLKTSGGLAMLVAQAYEASLIFRGLKFEKTEEAVEDIERVIKKLEDQMLTITLIGMPGSGKSTIGRKIAEHLGREFIDLDDEFLKRYEVTPAQVIEKQGEDEFRRMETALAKEILPKSGLVVSTGGGIVTREENSFFIKCNSRVIYIMRPLSCLMGQDTSDRPISRNTKIPELLEKRSPLYVKNSDIIWNLPGFKEGDEIVDRLIKEL